MTRALWQQTLWHYKVYPFFSLLRQSVLIWHTNFIVGENFVEILLSTVGVIKAESQLLNFVLMLIKENNCIECLIGLFPHFHDEEMSI
jgi:hypothetical protein